MILEVQTNDLGLVHTSTSFESHFGSLKRLNPQGVKNVLIVSPVGSKTFTKPLTGFTRDMYGQVKVVITSELKHFQNI